MHAQPLPGTTQPHSAPLNPTPPHATLPSPTRLTQPQPGLAPLGPSLWLFWGGFSLTVKQYWSHVIEEFCCTPMHAQPSPAPPNPTPPHSTLLNPAPPHAALPSPPGSAQRGPAQLHLAPFSSTFPSLSLSWGGFSWTVNHYTQPYSAPPSFTRPSQCYILLVLAILGWF